MADLTSEALLLFQSRQSAAARSLCESILAADPLHPRAMWLVGLIDLEAGLLSQAIRSLDHAVRLTPQDALVQHALGDAWRLFGNKDAALDCLHQALHLDPTLVVAYDSLGAVLLDLQCYADAVKVYGHALSLAPDNERLHLHLAIALGELNEVESAEKHFRSALAARPDYLQALNNLGLLLYKTRRTSEALPPLERAVALEPSYADAQFNLANVLHALGRPVEAITHFRECLRQAPNHAKAHGNLGLSLCVVGQHNEALAEFQKSFALTTELAEVWMNFASLLMQSQQYQKAQEAYERALTIRPDLFRCEASLIRVREMLCQWSRIKLDRQRLLELAQMSPTDSAVPYLDAFQAQSLVNWTPAQQLHLARRHAQALQSWTKANLPSLPVSRPLPHSGKIRLGYLSADFHNHATSHLMLGVFGLHDRSRFEVVGFSCGRDDESLYRRRIRQECDRFYELRGFSIGQALEVLQREAIDILVDLKGYTAEHRLDLLTFRPAAVQVHYLGYPGTLGADFIDYFIADSVTVPPTLRENFHEALVLMPHTSYVTDHRQEIGPETTREAQGLPTTGFVFGCFNQGYKMTPEMFSVWMKILDAVPQSVLWLLESSARMSENLRREAQNRGIAGHRLLFAKSLPKPQHLARLRLIDLCLDTFPYGAHTTGCDALYAEVPLLTLIGETYPSRVAASLLMALDMPELIVDNVGDYERLAITLAQEPERLSQVRAKVRNHRASRALFDTPRWVRDVETAYAMIWDRYCRGLRPETFEVPADDGKPGTIAF